MSFQDMTTLFYHELEEYAIEYATKGDEAEVASGDIPFFVQFCSPDWLPQLKELQHKALLAYFCKLKDAVTAPAVDEVAALLRATRLTQYGSIFAENDIDLLAIPLLQPEHWRTLGVSLGHQVRILHAARELGEIHGVVAAPMVQAPAPAAPVPALVEAGSAGAGAAF